MKKTLLILAATFYLLSCSKIGVYEKTVPIPEQAWFYDNKPSFTINILDTSAAYNIYIIVRHNDAYKYNNIWIELGSKAPGDTLQSQNINIELASDATGWEGNGMDDIWEVRKNITPGPVPFKKAGNYIFTISQIMREHPLKHILNVGIRVEKVSF